MRVLWEGGDEHRSGDGDEHSGATQCWVGRVVPVLAAASSSVGKRQRGVKRVETMIVARFGNVRRSGKRARDQQRLGRIAERVNRMLARLERCGHHVNYDTRPR